MATRSKKAASGAANAEATVEGDGILAVHGVLNFDTVPDVFAKSAAWVQKSQGRITIDLKNVERADSAGLALLVEWLQLARRQNRELTFANVPEQVRSLIRVNGLGQALKINQRG
ncbi:MAG TPA: STAS domain-containing protein [Burkholderiales bacterium]